MLLIILEGRNLFRARRSCCKFTGETRPRAIFCQEALRLIKQRMTERGVFAINLIGSIKENDLMTLSVSRTLKSVFPEVVIYPAFSPDAGESHENLAILAYSFPRVAPLSLTIGDFPVHAMAQKGLERSLGHPLNFSEDGPAFILTDEYNTRSVFSIPG